MYVTTLSLNGLATYANLLAYLLSKQSSKHVHKLHILGLEHFTFTLKIKA
jgi:hypothetical protein